MVIMGSDELLSSRENSDIVDQRGRISESASGISSDDDLIYRHILHSSSRRDLETLSKEPVTAKSCDGSELFSGTECIFTEKTSISKICDSGL